MQSIFVCSNISGIGMLTFQLHAEALEGTWKISVLDDGETETKVFKVEEYGK